MSFPNIPQIFPNTSLHVLRWNLYDLKAHSSGMAFASSLISNADTTSEVLPMIRPLGRGKPETQGTKLVFPSGVESCGSVGDEGIDYDWIDLGEEGFRSSHCELWIQTSRGASEKIWNLITTWIGTNNFGFAEKEMSHPICQPFGTSALEQTQYAKTLVEHLTQQPATTLLHLISPTQVPPVLKTIWYRSTVSMVANHFVNGIFSLVSAKDENAIKKILSESLSPFDLADYAILKSSTTLDPIPYIGSHMAAFAVNAVTSERHDYELRKHYDPLVAWPSHSKASSLTHFLKIIGF